MYTRNSKLTSKTASRSLKGGIRSRGKMFLTTGKETAIPPQPVYDHGARWAEMLPPVSSTKINNADGGLTEHVFPVWAVTSGREEKNTVESNTCDVSDSAFRKKWTTKAAPFKG